MSAFNTKRIFQRQVVKFRQKRCCQHTIERNTVLKKELYSISGFDAKRILQREIVKIWQSAVLNPKLSKTHFLRKSCTP